MPTSDALIAAEEWREIPGWPGYLVSNHGRAMRLACRGLDGRRLKERLLTLGQRRFGKNYIRVTVTLGNSENSDHFSIARLVLLAFVGPPVDGQECRHLNDEPTDCKLSNLAWGTRQENKDDAVRNDKVAFGENNGSAILSEYDVREIRSLYFQYRWSPTRISERYNVSSTAVSDIVKKKTWRRLR